MLKKIVCCTSGGGDSIADGLIMLTKGYEVIFLHIPHGQKSELGERLSVEAIVSGLQERGYPARSKIIDSLWLGKLGGSNLTDPNRPVPDGLEGTFGSTIGKIFTPNRNAVLLGIAGAVAEVERAEIITFGCNQSEVGYMDNTKDFLDAYTKVLEYSTYHIHPTVISPEWKWDKVEIYRWYHESGFEWALSLVWPCDDAPYTVKLPVRDRSDIIACGHCGCDRNRQVVYYILNKLYGYTDGQTYADPHWFEDVFLPEIRKRGIPDNKWFKKYEKVLLE